MIRLSRIAVIAASFILFFFASTGYAAPDKITDLAYSVQTDNSLFFTGKYQGKQINIVRSGVIGSGKWTIYTGTLADRVRLTIDDSLGLQEVLALDKGQRITINAVGQERIEYRFYTPDRKFVIGSVLYRSNNRWRQGMMKTEAFPGYPSLDNVSDVTKNFQVQSAMPAINIADWLQERWQRFNIISSAYAQESDNWIESFFSQSAQDARNRWEAPAHEMFKGGLIGLSAFTVRLVATAEIATIGGAAVVAAPLVAAVGAGVAIGLAADRMYRWADAKNLGGSTSMQDVYKRLVKPTGFSEELLPEVPPPLVTPSQESSNSRKSYQRPSDALKALVEMSAKQDKEDFRMELEKADACTQSGDFTCTEDHLAKAVKLTSSYTDSHLIEEARRKSASQKARIAEARSGRTGATQAGTTNANVSGAAIRRENNGPNPVKTFADSHWIVKVMGIDKKFVGIIFEAIFKRDGTMELPLFRYLGPNGESREENAASTFDGKWKTSGATIRFLLSEWEGNPPFLYEGNISGDHMEGKRINELHGQYLLWEAERKE